VHRSGGGPLENGATVVARLTEAIAERGAAPRSITLETGSEFAGRILEAWAMQHRVKLCFIRPDRPVENGFIESFNGRLRDECLNVEWFVSLQDAQGTLSRWRLHYNHRRPHSALNDRSSAKFAMQYGEAVERFAPMSVDKAIEQPSQGFAAPANVALDSAARSPEDDRYRSEALFRIAHAKEPLIGIWIAFQAHKHSAEEP
jgi:Integrase core domain